MKLSLACRLLAYMQEHTELVIAHDDFNSLSHDALCSFLSMKKMNLDDEMKLYEAAVTWATTNTTTNWESEARAGPSDREIRNTLGTALLLIRLPTADMKRFADVCGKSAVLTDKEKNDIYFYSLERQATQARVGINNITKVAGYSTVPRKWFSDLNI